MILPALLVSGLLAAGPLLSPTPAGQETVVQPDPERTVLRLSGTPISAAEYGAWLVRHRGPQLADDFGRALLVEHAAREAGVTVTAEEVAAAVDEEIRKRIEHAFNGDRERWIEELEALGRTELGLLIERSLEHRTELLLDGLLAGDRAIPEEALREEWETLYGRDGIRPRLRLIQFQTSGGRRRGPANAEQAAQAEADALARAEAAHARLLSGAEFARVATETSEDDSTRLAGGLAGDDFTLEAWRSDSVRAIEELAPGTFTKPLRGPGGFWIVKLIERIETPFESVRDELEASLLAQPPGKAEVSIYLTDLYGSAEPTVLPAMHRERGPLEARLPADEPVLRVGDITQTRGQFATWLMRYRGEGIVERFALWWEVERLAAKEKITVTPEQVAERVRSDRAMMIETGFNGDEESWNSEILSGGRDLDAWLREAALRTRTNLLCEALLIREREIDEGQIRYRWEETYGEDGIGIHLRSLVIEPVRPEFQPGMGAGDIDKLVVEAFAAAEKRASALVERVREGEDFVALVRQYSDDEETRDSGGIVAERFRPAEWPIDASEAVLALEPGQVTDPIRFADSYVVFELMERREVALEDVYDELEEELRNERPTEPELAGFRNLTLQGVSIDVLPGLYQ